MRYLHLIFITTVLVTFTACSGKKPFQESFEDNRNFHLFGGPSKKGPEDQWERCKRLEDEGKISAALRHARYLVETWPDHPLAMDALRLRAGLYFSEEQFRFAFDSYQALIDDYSGMFDYDEVLSLQLECARQMEVKKYSALFGLSHYLQPLEAIPMYEQILVNAPHIQDAPEILLTIGEIYMRKKQYINAVAQFTKLEQTFPESSFSETAALRKADAYRLRAKQVPTDLQPLEAELVALDHFLATYTTSEKLEEVRIRKHNAYNQLAKARFDKAQFYENSIRNPEAAIRTYESLIEQYPDSEWTPRAEERILELSESTTNP